MPYSRKLQIIASTGENKINVLLKATQRANYKNIVDMFDEMSIASVPVYALVDMNKSEAELIFQKWSYAADSSQR